MAGKPRWKTRWLSALDKIRAHLAASAPPVAEKTLEEFRRRFARARSRRQATAIESELDEVLESQPYFRGAVRRHVCAEVEDALAGVDQAIALYRQHKRLRPR